MRIMRGLHRAQRGDTIVEVLIAVAIISLVLTAAYATVNRNVAGIQNVQEHSDALKLVEGQVEFLRAEGSIPAGNVCFNPADGTPTSTNCTVGNAQYKLSITPPVGSGPYVVNADWMTLQGQDSNVTIFYRPMQ